MRVVHEPRNISWIFFAIIGICVLAWFIHTFAPINIFVILLFFVLVFITSFLLLLYLLNNVRRALLVTIGITVFLFLRMLGLHDWWYVILLLGSLASLELLFRKR